ncbi:TETRATRICOPEPTIDE REPEAT PROTEIN 5 [Salix viminalis]|uniref:TETRATRICOPEPTIDE REPEAT PROTEIN 5 n=1 Tax=Salix viminalis TaxID=40686 RepID=A0A9Q0NNV9_SALVM|nr:TETRATRICOPEPTIDE REPEAT PROTEIN 5 [Salix viminalis]
MLLRSSSTPVLNSWIPPHSKELSPEPDFLHQIQKTRSISLTASSSSPFSSISSQDHDSIKRITRAFSEADLRDLSVPKRKSRCENGEKGEGDNGVLEVLVTGGGSDGGGRKSEFGDDGGSGFWESSKGNETTDVYYQTMIEANPGNPLFLINYAKFLKEVRLDVSHKDASRAESYFDQAVKAAPDDCYVMASYARFLWDAEEEEEEGEQREV